MNHNNNFHFVRLVAASFVIITHAWLHTGNGETDLIFVLSQGTIVTSTIGMYMFFFTSGFLVTHSARTAENTIHFLFKRFLRIYPALIVLVLISVFVAGPLLTQLSTRAYYQHADTWLYLRNLLGINPRLFLPGIFEGPQYYIHTFNGPLWSVSLELKLYMSLAILLALGLIHKSRVHQVICSGILLTAYMVWLLNHYGYVSIKVEYKRDIVMIIVFFLGSLVQTCRPSDKFIGIGCILAGLVFVLRCAGVVVLMPLLDEILFLCFITYFIAHTKKFAIHLNNDISYGVYLYSVPVQQCCFILSGYNTSPWLNMAMAIGPIIGIAWLSWKCIEKPSLQLKSYYHTFTAALPPWR